MLCLVRMALWRHTDDEGQLSADPDSYEDENPKHIKLERNGVEIELHRYVINATGLLRQRCWNNGRQKNCKQPTADRQPSAMPPPHCPP